jgi:uncharacterized protein YdeI (YjbR/CyaY-like superfamily)
MESARSFASAPELDAWLRANHTTARELWVLLFKKGSGTPSVSWDDCVIAGLTWGWIDGTKRSLDNDSYLQRMTPRRPRSGWSKRNCEHAERLIAEGLMQPPGLAQVEAARADGRWEQAYAGSADMVIPDDFLAALALDTAAATTYASLDRASVFHIYYRLHTAKRPETRAKRLAALVAALARGEALR